VATKDIKTFHEHITCDVCGRTLLRGERAETYVAGGGERKRVCELCGPRARAEGWLREGTQPELEPRSSSREPRSGLFTRLRARREARAREEAPLAEPEVLPYHDRHVDRIVPEDAEPPPPRPPAPPPSPPREPRHVRAMPTSPEQKIASALELFNGSDNPRTIAGVARSLGAPAVSARPVSGRPSVVEIAVAWELCWYRYEVDLSENGGGAVHSVAQGYELDELRPEEREGNAVADEAGALFLPG
jgi:hypothetical protein